MGKGQAVSGEASGQAVSGEASGQAVSGQMTGEAVRVTPSTNDSLRHFPIRSTSTITPLHNTIIQLFLLRGFPDTIQRESNSV